METLVTSLNVNQISYNAIKDMMDDFNIHLRDGNAEFEAEIDFLVKGKRKISRSLVKIITQKEQFIITLLDRTFNPNLLPLEFRTGLQTFIYFVNQYLFIAGFKGNTSIGSYTVSISPKKRLGL